MDIVTKGFEFECFSGEVKRFVTGDFIEYIRYTKPKNSKACYPVGLHIRANNCSYKGVDFDIENYTKEITTEKHIQIKRLDSVASANNFLMTINKNDVVDIKPMENNTYLVIYVSGGGK